MNKTALLSAIAAAALLAGCRTTQSNHARRGVIGGSDSVGRQTASEGRASARQSRVRNAGAQQTVGQPLSGTVSETPLAPAQAQPFATSYAQPTTVYKPVAAQPQPVAVQAQPVAVQPQPVAVQPQPVAVQPQPAAATAAAPAFETYVVKRGDVAGRIANSHGMTLKEFMEANDMTLEQAGKLRENQKVKVWSGASPLAAGPAVQASKPVVSDDPNVHVVQSGDTLLGISAKTGVPVATLMANNSIDNPNAIRVGQKLVLKKTAAEPAAQTAKKAVDRTVEPVKRTAKDFAENAKQSVEPIVQGAGQSAKKAAETAKRSAKETSEDAKQTVQATADNVKQTVKRTFGTAEPQPQQDASVPLDEVKVAGTDLSIADILDGASLSDAREQAEEKKDAVARQVREAAQGAADAAGDAPAGYKYYVVKEGETLYHLGARYKVPFKTLRELNNLPPGASKLEAGTRLLVPDTAAVEP